MLQEPAFGLLLDPGLGKTAITLAAFDLLRREGIVRRMLVVAPLRVAYDVWPDEVQKWKEFNHLKVEILHGPKKEERLESDADIFLINPEGVSWLVQKRARRRISERDWDWPEMLVIDESTKFKHGGRKGSARWAALETALGKFERRYILTGTPAPNGFHDLWGQIYLLDHGERLGITLGKFRRRFFIPAWDGHGFEIRDERAEQEIIESLSDIVLRLDAKDYLKLPPLVHKTIGVNLPTEGRVLYEQLKEDLVLQMEEGEVTAANAGVLSSKLRQAASGRVYMDEDDMVLEALGDVAPNRAKRAAFLHDAKIDALEDLIEELQGQPLMVAYEFRHDLEALREAFGDDVPVLGAGTTAAKGKKITRAWNEGRVPLLLAHPASAGWGLNLQEGGSNICWYSLTWNLEHYDQLIARQWRQGQKKPVFVYHLVANHTIDVDVALKLQEKDATQQGLLEALKESVTH